MYDIKIEEANYIKAGIEYKIPGKILKQELYKEDGTDREDSLQYMYEKTVANKANLSDFEDFIFLSIKFCCLEKVEKCSMVRKCSGTFV